MEDEDEQLAEHRQRVVDEIVGSERTHVATLCAVVDLYITPLRERALVSADELWRLFSTWELLLGFHRALLAELEAAARDERRVAGSASAVPAGTASEAEAE